MQDRYACDIGDYGKYGLLRFLTGMTSGASGSALRPGVLWYRSRSRGTGREGTRVRYLLQGASGGIGLRSCDPVLFDALKGLLMRGMRTIPAIQESGIFPAGTIFFGEPVPGKASPSKRVQVSPRQEWFSRALESLSAAELVYLDPDTGIFTGDARTARVDFEKYALPGEIGAFISRSQSVVAYHHLHRRAPASFQIARLAERIRELLGSGQAIFPLRYHRGGARVFLIAPAEGHVELLASSIERLLEGSPWGNHFTLSGGEQAGTR